MTIVEFDELSPLDPAALEQAKARALKFYAQVPGRYIARMYRFGGPIDLGAWVHSVYREAQGEPLAGIAAAGLR